RVRIAGLTPYALRSTLDTAEVDTCARRATSAIVTLAINQPSVERTTPHRVAELQDRRLSTENVLHFGGRPPREIGPPAPSKRCRGARERRHHWSGEGPGHLVHDLPADLHEGPRLLLLDPLVGGQPQRPEEGRRHHPRPGRGAPVGDRLGQLALQGGVDGELTGQQSRMLLGQPGADRPLPVRYADLFVQLLDRGPHGLPRAVA